MTLTADQQTILQNYLNSYITLAAFVEYFRNSVTLVYALRLVIHLDLLFVITGYIQESLELAKCIVDCMLFLISPIRCTLYIAVRNMQKIKTCVTNRHFQGIIPAWDFECFYRICFSEDFLLPTSILRINYRYVKVIQIHTHTHTYTVTYNRYETSFILPFLLYILVSSGLHFLSWAKNMLENYKRIFSYLYIILMF